MTILAEGGGTAQQRGPDASGLRLKRWCGVVKTGSGLRGGTWNNDITNARVSDRNNAANDNTNRNNNNGARLAKTFTLMQARADARMVNKGGTARVFPGIFV